MASLEQPPVSGEPAFTGWLGVSGGPAAQDGAGQTGPLAESRTAGWSAGPAGQDERHRRSVIAGIGFALLVAGGIVLYLFMAGSPPAPGHPAASSGRAAHRSTGHGRHTGPGNGTGQGKSHPVPKISHTSAAQSSPPVATQPLIPVSAVAFGPGGTAHGDDPQRASLAIDRNPASGWITDWYATAHFGNLQQGTGLLLDMGRPVTITAARITLGSAAGAGIQLRVGGTPVLADLRPAAAASNAGGVLQLRLSPPAQGRYVLVWFTRLPPDNSGTFRGSIYDIGLRGHP